MEHCQQVTVPQQDQAHPHRLWKVRVEGAPEPQLCTLSSDHCAICHQVRVAAAAAHSLPPGLARIRISSHMEERRLPPL